MPWRVYMGWGSMEAVFVQSMEVLSAVCQIRDCIPNSKPQQDNRGDGREQKRGAAPSIFLAVPPGGASHSPWPGSAIPLGCWVRKTSVPDSRGESRPGGGGGSAALAQPFRPRSPVSLPTLSPKAGVFVPGPPPPAQYTGPLRLKSRLASCLGAPERSKSLAAHRKMVS